MCRMISVMGENEKITDYMGKLELQAFAGRNSRHGDGYGVAYFRNGSLHTRKESGAIWDRKNTYTPEDNGNVLFLHARKAGVGKVDLGNVHPFTAQYDEFTFSFMHNGTVNDIGKIGMHQNLLESGSITDSQIIFEMFVENHKVCVDLGEALKKTIEDVVENCIDISALNIVVSDGEDIAVSRCFFKMEEYYEIFYKPEKSRIIISTEKFDANDNNWVLMENNTITIFENCKACKISGISI